jgi:hypothetical protein
LEGVEAEEIARRAQGAGDLPLRRRVEAFEEALAQLEELLAKAGPA